MSLRYRKPEQFSEIRLGVKKEKTICFFPYFSNSHCQFCILPSLDYGFRVLVQYHLVHTYIKYSSSRHIIKEDSHFSLKIVRNFVSGSRLNLTARFLIIHSTKADIVFISFEPTGKDHYFHFGFCIHRRCTWQLRVST